MKKISLFFLFTIVITLGGCNDSKPSVSPNVVTFNSSTLYPEGIAWDDRNERFLVTSIRKGEIGSVKDDGSYWVFAKDSRMVSSVGIQIDKKRDRVLVCNADPGAAEKSSPKTTGKLAGLAVFSLSSGALIKYIDLAKGIKGGHFCNDLTIDKEGNAYITDSFSSVIYKVDADYNASVLVNDKTFSGKSFNLNGIVVKDNYLLAVKMNSGQLFKIPLDKPSSFKEVTLKQKIYGADGLLWGPDGSLILIANNNAYVGATPATATDKVFKLTSSDNWASASIIGQADTGDVFATTGTVRNGQVYVMHSMLQVLFNPKTKKHLEKFGIHKYNP